MIRVVKKSDLELIRKIRNKWHHLGLFRQDHNISKKEQLKWYEENKDNPGYIINDRAYGKIYSDNEIAFFGFDEWEVNDLQELINSLNPVLLYGECYQNNQFLTMWLDAGFKVTGHQKNRKYWDGRMWDSLLLTWSRNDIS